MGTPARLWDYNALMDPPAQLLLSLPPRMCQHLARQPAAPHGAFWTHDPPDLQLGSGGGTAYLLSQAWRASQNSPSLVAGRAALFGDPATCRSDSL